MNTELAEESAIRVVLADNQRVARLGTREVLERADDIAIVAETASGAEALRLVRERAADVLVAEMNLPDISGIQLAVRLAEVDAPVQLLAFTAYEEERYIRHLLENGIAGYLKKDDPVHYLVEATRALACGEEDWLSPSIAQAVMKLEKRKDAAARLDACNATPREREVLRLIAQGLSNREIANTLFISKNTVRTHISRVYDKLGVRAREQAVAWAWKHGLMDEE